MLQCFAVYCSVLQRVAACCSVLQCSVLQYVAVCSSVLQCVVVCLGSRVSDRHCFKDLLSGMLQCVAVCCSVQRLPGDMAPQYAWHIHNLYAA